MYRTLLLLCVFSPAIASASALEHLQQFISGTKNLSSHFVQTVENMSGQELQRFTGQMTLSRPGKFRWEVKKPYPQQIISDGVKIWIYDPELKQVTIKKQSEGLNGTPADLLSGDSELDRHFKLSDSGRDGEIEWMLAQPKKPDTGFESIRMGFLSGNLRYMVMDDSFGQQTRIEFSKIDKQPKIGPEFFKFTPPPGVDVVGE